MLESSRLFGIIKYQHAGKVVGKLIRFVWNAVLFAYLVHDANFSTGRSLVDILLVSLGPFSNTLVERGGRHCFLMY